MTEKSYTEAVAEFGAQMAELRGEAREGFATINGRLDTLITQQEAANTARMSDIADLRIDRDDHEVRIRSLETRMSDEEARPRITPKGAWAVALAVAGLAVGVLALVF